MCKNKIIIIIILPIFEKVHRIFVKRGGRKSQMTGSRVGDVVWSSHMQTDQSSGGKVEFFCVKEPRQGSLCLVLQTVFDLQVWPEFFPVLGEIIRETRVSRDRSEALQCWIFPVGQRHLFRFRQPLVRLSKVERGRGEICVVGARSFTWRKNWSENSIKQFLHLHTNDDLQKKYFLVLVRLIKKNNLFYLRANIFPIE